MAGSTEESNDAHYINLRGFINEGLDKNYILIENNRLIWTNLIKRDLNKAISINRVSELAQKLHDIAPKGFKSGGIYFKSNVQDVAINLERFFKLYNYTDEEIVSATQVYIDRIASGELKFFKSLSAFIIKNKESLLASYVVNLEEGDTSYGNDV